MSGNNRFDASDLRSFTKVVDTNFKNRFYLEARPEGKLAATLILSKILIPTNFSFGDAHIDISSRGVPRDDHKILKLMEKEPSVLFLPSVLCYIAGASARKLMEGAQQVVVVNNHLAGVGLPYNGRARSLPEEILEDLSNAGLNNVKVIQGEYFLAGVFQRQ